MPDIVISEFMDEAAVRSLAADFDVLFDPDLHKTTDALARAVAACRGLIVRNQTQVRGELLGMCKRLEAIGRLGVGLDNIDVELCRTRGISVLPATGANDAAVAEYVIAGLLMLFRGAYHASAAVAEGGWPRQKLIGREVAGKVLGLVGFGGIARQVAARATALGMRVVAYDPLIPADGPAWAEYGVEPRLLNVLLKEADAVSLHVPLNDSTRGLISAGAIAAMRRGTILINSARGQVVDEAALAAALKDGRLGGAMLDVFAAEPLPAGNVFHGAPNLILTPHIAGVTAESNVRVSAVTAENRRRALSRRAAG